jgi:hypothetical protein
VCMLSSLSSSFDGGLSGLNPTAAIHRFHIV